MPEEIELRYEDIDWGKTTQQPDKMYIPELRPEDIDFDKAPEVAEQLKARPVQPKPKRVAVKPKPAQRVRPVKPLPIEQRQVFRPQLPPDIGEQAASRLAMKDFKFDTRPYKAFEAMTPQEKLQQARERKMPSVRAATQAEVQQVRDLEDREKTVRDRLSGPTLFGMVEPMREVGHAHDVLTYQIPNVFLKGVSAMPEGAAEVGRLALRKLVPKWAPSAEGPASPTLRKFTEYMEKEVDEAFPTRGEKNPVAQVVGSTAQFIIPGGALTKLGVPAKLAMGSMGAASNVQQIAREMEGMNVDPQRKDAAIAMAVATGLTEMAGLGSMLDKFGLQRTFTRQLLNIAEEGGQEGVSNWLNNLNARFVGGYDPKRPMTKGMAESIILGLAGGAMFQGVSNLAVRDRARTQERLYASQLPSVTEPTGETAPTQPSLFGEDLGVKKVGKRGPKPKQQAVMPTEEEQLLDVEGGFEIPIPTKEEVDAPTPTPLTDAIKERRPPTEEVLKDTDPETGLPMPPKTQVSRTFKELGRGGNATVYDISDRPEEVLRVPNGMDPATVNFDDFVPVVDPYEGIKVGQAIAIDPSTGASLRQKQAGEPAGMTHTEMTNQEEDDAKYANRINMAAAMPQYAYDTLAREIKKVNKRGGAFDPSKANNLLIDKAGKRFNMVDITDRTPGSLNTMADFLLPLVGNTYGWRYKGADLSPARRRIIEKAAKAAKRVGLTFTTPDNPSVQYSFMLAGLDPILANGMGIKEVPTPQPAQDYIAPREGRPDLDRIKDRLYDLYREMTDVEAGAKAAHDLGRTDWVEAFLRRGKEISNDVKEHINELEKWGEDGMTFDIVPASEGKSPIMIVPGWVISALTNGRGHMQTGGVFIAYDQLDKLKENIKILAPSPEHATKAEQALDELTQMAKEEDQAGVAFVHQWMPAEKRAMTVQHETFHAAQNALAIKVDAFNKFLDQRLFGFMGERPAAESRSWHLHNPTWAFNHPLIRDIMQKRPWIPATMATPGIPVEDVIAVEIPAYVLSGDHANLGLTEDEGMNFVFDYIGHLMDLYGPDSFDVLIKVAKVRPEMIQPLEDAKGAYDEWKREQAEARAEAAKAPAENPSQFSDFIESLLGPYPEGTEPATGERAASLVGQDPSQEFQEIQQALFIDRGWDHDSEYDYYSLSEGYDFARIYPQRDGRFTVRVSGKDIGTYDSLIEAKSAGQQALDNVNVSRDSLARKVPDLLAAIEQRYMELEEKGIMTAPQTPDEWSQALKSSFWGYGEWQSDPQMAEYAEYMKQAYPEKAKYVEEEQAKSKERQAKYDATKKEQGFEGWTKGAIEQQEAEALAAIGSKPALSADPLTREEEDELYRLEQDLAKIIKDEQGVEIGGYVYPTLEEYLTPDYRDYAIERIIENHPGMYERWGELKDKSALYVQATRAATDLRDQESLDTISGLLPIQGSRAATNPTPKVGDKVKIKGYAGYGTISEVFEDGVAVTWSGERGTDEFTFDQIIKIVPPSTSKAPRKTAAQAAVAQAPVIREAGDPHQMWLPGMEGAVTPRIAEPPIMPPSQPPLPGMGGRQFPPVMEERVSNQYNTAVVTGFINLLENEGIRFDPNRRVFLQVADALMMGRITSPQFEAALEENGLTIEQFKDEFKATATESGRTLQQLSRIKMKWLKAMKKNPNLREVLFTPGELFESVMEDINNTKLGLSVWQRATSVVRMLMLSDLHTAAVNAFMTAYRVPLVIGSHGGGAWMKSLAESGGSGKSLIQRLEDANDASLDAMRAGAEVLLALNPVDFTKAALGVGRSRTQEHIWVVDELMRTFPDLERRLKSPGIGMDTPKELGDQLDIAADLIRQMRTSGARESALKELKVAQDRFNSNMRGMGMLLHGPEVVLDFVLTPMRWQEWFFRRPMFVGYLDLALRRRKMDLWEMARAGELQNIPEEVLEEAIDEALDFTYAYMPKVDGPGMEKAAHHIIKGINEMKGLASIIGTMFPRAVYNGMKFTYEYSPVGAYPGIKKMLRPEYTEDPVTGVTYRTNPLLQKDYDRFAKAALGTIMFTGAMALIKWGLMGDEWWQVKTHRNTPDGKPIYLDIRRYQPFATFYRLADLTTRAMTDLGIMHGNRSLGDLKLGTEIKETITGLRQFPGLEEYVTAAMEMWADDQDSNVYQKAASSVGMGASFFTRPFVNLRHAVQIFDEEELKKRDLKGTGMLGPLMDNIPWLRRQLPEVKSMTERPPIKMHLYPETLFVGAKYVQGEGFAGREWRRLGLLNRRFLDPDPNPKINRAQNEFFQQMISDIGDAAEKDPNYLQMNDKERAAYWEMIVRVVAPDARAYGVTADPAEGVKRDAIQQMDVGPLTRKMMGLNDMFKEPTPTPSPAGSSSIRILPGLPRK